MQEVPGDYLIKSMTKHSKNLEKIVINVGVGRMATQPNFTDKFLPEAVKELSLLTGQKPATRTAKKSIAGFKLRVGSVVGLKVTLRGHRMEDFLEKLVNVVLPRVKDFRGLDTKSIDNSGNLNIGFKEHLSFPEISPDNSKVNFGMEVTFVLKNRIKEKEKAVAFYKELGVPFKKS